MKPFKHHHMRLLHHNCVASVFCTKEHEEELVSFAECISSNGTLLFKGIWPKKLVLVMLTCVKTHHLFSQAVK